MDFSLTDDQDLIRTAVAKVCADYPDEYWAERDQNHDFPWDFYNAMANAGWIGTAIPEAYGGSGMGITEASVVLEEVAASGAAMNGATPLHLSMFGMEPVVKYGSEEMKQMYLRWRRARCMWPLASPNPMRARIPLQLLPPLSVKAITTSLRAQGVDHQGLTV